MFTANHVCKLNINVCTWRDWYISHMIEWIVESRVEVKITFLQKNWKQMFLWISFYAYWTIVFYPESRFCSNISCSIRWSYYSKPIIFHKTSVISCILKRYHIVYMANFCARILTKILKKGRKLTDTSQIYCVLLICFFSKMLLKSMIINQPAFTCSKPIIETLKH